MRTQNRRADGHQALPHRSLGQPPATRGTQLLCSPFSSFPHGSIAGTVFDAAAKLEILSPIISHFFLLRIEHGMAIEETSHGISSTRITLANMISKHRSNHPSDLMIHTVGQNLTRQLKH